LNVQEILTQVYHEKAFNHFIFGLFVFVFFISSTFASWLVFSKPEFRGRIIDAQSKNPRPKDAALLMPPIGGLGLAPGGADLV